MCRRSLLGWSLAAFLVNVTVAGAGSDACCFGAPVPPVAYTAPLVPFVMSPPAVYLPRPVRPYCLVSQVSYPRPSCAPDASPWPYDYPYVFSYGGGVRHR